MNVYEREICGSWAKTQTDRRIEEDWGNELDNILARFESSDFQIPAKNGLGTHALHNKGRIVLSKKH